MKRHLSATGKCFTVIAMSLYNLRYSTLMLTLLRQSDTSTSLAPVSNENYVTTSTTKKGMYYSWKQVLRSCMLLVKQISKSISMAQNSKQSQCAMTD